MIILDYSLEPSELQRLEGVDLTNVTDTQLDYYLFCGNVVFRIDDAIFDAQWGWVTIIDYVTQLHTIIFSIQEDEARVLEYTESEATIEFHRVGYTVEVTAEYASAKATASLHDLQHSVAVFCQRVMNDLVTQWPDLALNTSFKQRMSLIESSESTVN